ncbi:MAG: agmatinase [Candidatus Thalassarchaeaceae archaeon]|jgi:agmatinase|nr:agmatinase [Candidatus Thalassarchaeaceae archaeon]MDP7043836.1 agmatinase [Candidatus Thalassarchaeaceae archaeon]
MGGEFSEGQFLGLAPKDGDADIVILSLPYELTTSYGQGTANGPAACIEASGQVELYDSLLDDDLPAGYSIVTAQPWDGEGGTLEEQLEGIEQYLKEWFTGDAFPVVLGGEHGSLPAEMRALSNHPTLGGNLGGLTLVQIDAHADLRDELDGEKYSHACAARRALDEGVGNLIQIGVRAYSREEEDFITNDERVKTWFARDFISPCGGEKVWHALLAELSSIEGPVWLTLDIDGLDGTLVPNTGTPVPGGLTYWQTVQVIETLFSASSSEVIGADVVEIVPGIESNLTQFTAAMLATKIVAAHMASV